MPIFESDFGSDNFISLSYLVAAFSANLFGLFFLAQQDVYEGEPSETQDDDNGIDGSFEVVPGVTADEYIKRFSTIEISNPTDRRNFRIRVPPAPETFYDIGNNEAQKAKKIGLVYSSLNGGVLK